LKYNFVILLMILSFLVTEQQGTTNKEEKGRIRTS